MMDLDTRARQATAGLKRQVAAAELSLAAPPSARLREGLHPAWSLAAGAIAALILLVGISVIRPVVVADETEEVLSPTTSTAPAPETTVSPTTVADAVPVVPTGEEAPPPPPPPTADVTPPIIEIVTPTDGQIFTDKTITFAGVTEPGARVFAGDYEAEVDPEGNWNIVLRLSVGANPATFVAVDAAGNEATATVTPVYRPVEVTTTQPKEVAAFTAGSIYGQCSEIPPYDVYHGTGQPGSTISVTSDYGSGQTTVGPGGGWELRVEFPEAPVGEAFAVKVKDSLGRSKIFEFVHTAK
jgi:hypothetical protein